MAIWLPIPRLPVCSTIQSRLSSSEEISTKWFPPPKVPNCFPILPMAFVALDSVFTCGIGFSSSHLRAVGSAALCQSKPAGTPRRMSRRICCGCSRSFNRRLVRAAIMPQPMSTPTAAGRMAPSVTITDPTVAPFPKWASGISATGPCQHRAQRGFQRLLPGLGIQNRRPVPHPRTAISARIQVPSPRTLIGSHHGL